MPASRTVVRAYALTTLLLSGGIDAATLDASLADQGNSDAFNFISSNSSLLPKVLSSSTAMGILNATSTAFSQFLDFNDADKMAVIAASADATDSIVGDSTLAQNLVMSAVAMNAYTSVPSNYAYLQSKVNAVGSKLKRQVFSANGVWTKPTTVVACAVLLVGAGGKGGTELSSAGAGGGGAQLLVKNIDPASISGDVTVTVGTTSAASTSFGALATAVGGGNASNGTPGSGGSSGTASGSFTDLTETNLASSVWQITEVNLSGGNGGTGGSGYKSGGGGGGSLDGHIGGNGVATPGGAGSGASPLANGNNASGGTGGASPGNGAGVGGGSTVSGGDGTGAVDSGTFGGGGGGGGGTSSSYTNGGAGAFGGGGGGGAGENSSASTGNQPGNGGPGVAIVYWIEE